jgi:hypothetical protein
MYKIFGGVYMKNNNGDHFGLAIAGFCCSLVGLIIFAFLGILAVVFCGIAMGDEKGTKSKGFAIAGLSIGILDIIGMIYNIAMLS